MDLMLKLARFHLLNFVVNFVSDGARGIRKGSRETLSLQQVTQEHNQFLEDLSPLKQLRANPWVQNDFPGRSRDTWTRAASPGQVRRGSGQLIQGHCDPLAARAPGSPGDRERCGSRARARPTGQRLERQGAGLAATGPPRPPMMRRPPTRPRPVTHSSPWLQHKATSPGGRFLPEEQLVLPEKAQAEEEAEEEEGNRRFPNTLSEGLCADRGSRPSDARRRERGPGLPEAPFPVPAPHRPGTKLPRATGPEVCSPGRVLWPRRRRRRASSAPGALMGAGNGGGAHGGDRSHSGGGGGGGVARGDAAAVGRDGRAQ